MKVEHLALNILKNDKLNAETIVRHLASAIDEDIDSSQEYKELYETAYGETLSNELINDWVKSMAVTDGSDRETGQKWTLDQTTEVGNKINFDWNKHSKYEFYCVMNMMYSDFYKLGKSFGLENDPLFYARMAKEWLCDEDIKSKNKLYNYYFSVIV